LDKAPDAFRTISEVADDLDVPQHVLRFWETRFSQIKPMKRSGGRRYYRPDDVNLLRGIRRLLYGEGYTIRGVQRILREHGVKSVQNLADGMPDHASALFDAPAAGLRDRGSDEADGEAAEHDEVLAADAAQPGRGDKAFPAPLSLDELGPPLHEPAAPALPKPVAVKAPEPASGHAPSGAEAYAPPSVRKGARPLDRGRLQAALDDLIGARALIDKVLKDG
jgi:DNA-binding transcriptional MerR regulator